MNRHVSSPAKVALGNVAVFNPQTPRLLPSDRVAFVPMASVSEQGSMTAEVAFVADLKPGFSYFQNGDVLVAKITPCYENNKITVANFAQEHGFGSTEFHVIRSNPRSVDSNYLMHFLRQDSIRRAGEQRMTGSGGQRRVPRQFLEDLSIPLPPLNKQRRIAAILDQADDLRRKRRAALERALELRTAMLASMLAGSGSTNMSLAQVAEFENGDRSSNYPSGDDIKSSGVLFLSTKNILEDAIDFSVQRYISNEKFASLTQGKARHDDILITLRGTLGSCCIFRDGPAEAFINAQMMIIRPKPGYDVTYLHAVLTSKKIKQNLLRVGNGAAIPQLTTTQLSGLELQVVSFGDQQAFAARVAEIDKLKASHRAHLAQLDALFASLQHRAFRGDL